jgi:hypothetical protein
VKSLSPVFQGIKGFSKPIWARLWLRRRKLVEMMRLRLILELRNISILFIKRRSMRRLTPPGSRKSDYKLLTFKIYH